MASIEITMRHSDVRIEALKDYAQQRMEKLCAAYPKVTKVTCCVAPALTWCGWQIGRAAGC